MGALTTLQRRNISVTARFRNLEVHLTCTLTATKIDYIIIDTPAVLQIQYIGLLFFLVTGAGSLQSHA